MIYMLPCLKCQQRAPCDEDKEPRSWVCKGCGSLNYWSKE